MIKGSSTLFKALLDRCLARDVVAICRYIPRQNAQPFFVALVPQAEKLDDNNTQIESPGFHVIFLPFAEDFRTLHIEQSPKGINLYIYGNSIHVHVTCVPNCKIELLSIRISFKCGHIRESVDSMWR